MMTQSRFSRSVSVVLSLVVVTVGGLIVVMGTGLGSRLIRSVAHVKAPQQKADPMLDPGAYPRHPIALSAEASPALPTLPGDLMASAATDANRGRCDDIVVEIKQDGSLRVLGEPMKVDAFRSLLGNQLREQLQTMVTICPDDNSLFRHLDPVISVCDEVGVPHRMQPRTTPTRAGPVATGSA